MNIRRLAAAIAVCALVSPLGVALAADDAAQLRLFLKDGTSLVSYGEFARVGDRVVFSMPTATTPNPPLQLVTLAADRVDWLRTERYSAAARAAHYLDTQADLDFAALSNQIAQTLNAVTVAADPATRLRLVEGARKVLADWPQNHFNFKRVEVRQMVSLLDEAIADLRLANGTQRFDLALSAFVELPGIPEPLLPPPTPQQAIEQILAAARLAETPAERSVLLSTALTSLNRDRSFLPPDWAISTHAATNAAIAQETQIDRSYQSLTRRMTVLADNRARLGDVRGLERLLVRIHQTDATLGAKRPDSVSALIAAVEAQLDAARRIQLARDRWALRAPAFQRYRLAIRPAIDLFAALKPALEEIKSLSGSSPAALTALQRSIDSIVERILSIVPPVELRAAHALLLSAAELAENAGRIRRQAIVADDIKRAWDASSAAAGALMLAAKARTDIQDQLRPPQNR